MNSLITIPQFIALTITPQGHPPTLPCIAYIYIYIYIYIKVLSSLAPFCSDKNKTDEDTSPNNQRENILKSIIQTLKANHWSNQEDHRITHFQHNGADTLNTLYNSICRSWYCHSPFSRIGKHFTGYLNRGTCAL